MPKVTEEKQYVLTLLINCVELLDHNKRQECLDVLKSIKIYTDDLNDISLSKNFSETLIHSILDWPVRKTQSYIQEEYRKIYSQR